MNKGTALVTGSNGFVGSHLCEKLIDEGWHVKALVRKTSNLRFIQHLKMEIVYGELSDPQSLAPILENVDVVFNPAGLVKARDGETFMRVNRDGTNNLAEAVKQHKPDIKRFVHISSQAAAGPAESLVPVTEKDRPHPVSDYGHSKLESENAVLRFKDDYPVTIIRPPAVYGPRDIDVYKFFRMIGLGFNVKLGFDHKFVSMIHVRDLADICLLAAENDKAVGESFFACNPGIYEMDFLMALIADVMRKDTVDVIVPVSVANAIAHLVKSVSNMLNKIAPFAPDKIRELSYNYWICSAEKAEDLLGWRAGIAIEDGFRETYKWYKMEGWL